MHVKLYQSERCFSGCTVNTKKKTIKKLVRYTQRGSIDTLCPAHTLAFSPHICVVFDVSKHYRVVHELFLEKKTCNYDFHVFHLPHLKQECTSHFQF